MPKDHDFKRLVRARMTGTGERYTTARAGLAAQREPGGAVVSDRSRSLLGQLADVEVAAASRGHLSRLPEPERRAAAIEGLRHRDWRVRRTCAWLLDPIDLTPESVAALTRALDDEHPQVRRKAVHALGCENCKPNGCAVDVRPLFERAIGDDSVLVRSMVIHVVTLHFFHHQWAVDLVARTQRHPGFWVVVRDGRVVATGRDSKASRRELNAGGCAYWVAPPGTARPRIP